MIVKKRFAWILPIVIVLSGCQSFSNNSVDSSLTNDNSAEFFSKSGWQSCAIGAGVGGLTCYLMKGNATTCLITAAATCGVAMGGNYYLDAKRSQYANEETRLNAYIEDVKTNTAQVKSVTDNAKIILNKNLATLKTLNQQIAANQVDEAQVKQELASIDANIAYLNDKLERMKTVEQDWHVVATKEKEAGVNVSKLDSQIVQLNKQIRVLENQINLVTQQRSALRMA